VGLEALASLGLAARSADFWGASSGFWQPSPRQTSATTVLNPETAFLNMELPRVRLNPRIPL